MLEISINKYCSITFLLPITVQNNFLFQMQRKVLGSQVILDKKKNDVTESAGTKDSKHGSKENISMVRFAGRRVSYINQWNLFGKRKFV